MAKQRGYQRVDRVNQQLLEMISRLVLAEVRDPRVKAAQITAVATSPDLHHARVFYVALEESADREALQEGLDRASGFVRRELGQRLAMRHVPQLQFIYDESIDRGRRIEQLLADVSIPDRRESEEEE